MPRGERELVAWLGNELATATDLRHLVTLLGRGNRVLAASHLPTAWLAPLRLRWRVAAFRTDRDPAKLGRHLDRLGVAWSPRTLAAYTARYGASYTELDLIRERHPGPDFDRSYRRFHRFERITRAPATP